jgi:hypothetical protein
MMHENCHTPTKSISIMNRRFNVDSLCHVLTTDKAGAIIATQREIQKTATRTKKFPRTWPLVGFAEFVAGVLAVFYLVAAVALGGALLFFTFCH